MKLQSSIRELLLIVAIIALMAGWLIDHNRLSSMANQKWEFKVADWNGADKNLKFAGSEGWEICGAYTEPSNPGLPLVFLKRRIP